MLMCANSKVSRSKRKSAPSGRKVGGHTFHADYVEHSTREKGGGGLSDNLLRHNKEDWDWSPIKNAIGSR